MKEGGEKTDLDIDNGAKVHVISTTELRDNRSKILKDIIDNGTVYLIKKRRDQQREGHVFVLKSHKGEAGSLSSDEFEKLELLQDITVGEVRRLRDLVQGKLNLGDLIKEK